MAVHAQTLRSSYDSTPSLKITDYSFLPYLYCEVVRKNFSFVAPQSVYRTWLVEHPLRYTRSSDFCRLHNSWSQPLSCNSRLKGTSGILGNTKWEVFYEKNKKKHIEHTCFMGKDLMFVRYSWFAQLDSNWLSSLKAYCI